MTDTTEEKPGKVTVSGHTIEVGEGRSVFVGHADGDSSFYLRFINGETDTQLRLTPEAARALHSLLGDIVGGKGSLSRWVLYAAAAMDEASGKTA